MCEHGHHHHHAYPAGEAAAGGPVVLDIGGDRGALLVYLDRSRIGGELHIRPETGVATHTGVWERPAAPDRPVVAVFPSLAAGRYTILGDDGGGWRDVAVDAGAVTETHLAG
jgi:hypothetical protein